ncbi:MAG: hypothetical protein R6T92_06570, partial [Desulfosalsimonadaceae bacterium]
VTVNGNESRCLQANETYVKNTGETGTLPYTGTIDVTPGDIVRVQYQVDNTDMDFEGDAVFDSPVAVSVNFEQIATK